MDNLVSSPEIIGAIIGGIFLLLTTIIGGWFNVRAAQIRTETERAARSPRPRPRKTDQPAAIPEEKPQWEMKEQKRPLPIWLLITGATVGAVLLIGGLGLSGILPIFHPPATPTPTKTPLQITTPVDMTLSSTGTPAPLGFPGNLVNTNSDWPNPIIQTFDGIEMALVPAGCFIMGSDAGDEDELNGDKQCFEQPFWINVTEVTNKQFRSKGTFSGDEMPRESVLWREAAAFCDEHGGRLPTEAEWEYAARGPDNWLYPWGDTIPSDARAVYRTSADDKIDRPSNVGSKTLGASWVGALDMSGNVWEWVSSLYRPYPYDKDDGRESTTLIEERVMRGGSFEGHNIRASERSSRDQAYNYKSVGFRCARDWSQSDPMP